MKRETYLWILLFVAIISVALYFRYFYQSSISMELSINNTVTTPQLYPYQKVRLPILVYNSGGSAIKDMNIGIEINNNLTTLYKVTLPAGKQTIILFNYTPSAPGTYNITAMADPSGLYDISNKEKAVSRTVLFVKSPENATPYALLQSNNLTSLQSKNLGRGGYLVNAYINSQYGMNNFALTNIKRVNEFLSPILNLTAYYISEMAISNAGYANNDSASSVWMMGYLDPSIIHIAANAAGLQTHNVSTRFGTTTFVKVSDNTTLCSWYYGGWLKLLSYTGSATCYGIINASSSGTINGLTPATFYDRVVLKNASTISNYTGTTGSANYVATLSFIRNSSFVYAKIANNTATNSVCYGIIKNENNTHYCSTYILPVSGGITGLSLIKTTAYVNTYNLTVMSLANTSVALEQVPLSINTIRSFNISGNSLVFKSGLVNTCAFNESFPCSNATFRNGNVTFRLVNNDSKSVNLNSLRCYTSGASNITNLNTVLSAGSGVDITAQCYDHGAKITGVPLNLNLNLLLNYTVSNETRTLTGKVYMPFG